MRLIQAIYTSDALHLARTLKFLMFGFDSKTKVYFGEGFNATLEIETGIHSGERGLMSGLARAG